MTPFAFHNDRFRRFELPENASFPVLIHPLPRRLLPESRGCRVSRLRATLRRPPALRPSLS